MKLISKLVISNPIVNRLDKLHAQVECRMQKSAYHFAVKFKSISNLKLRQNTYQFLRPRLLLERFSLFFVLANDRMGDEEACPTRDDEPRSMGPSAYMSQVRLDSLEFSLLPS